MIQLDCGENVNYRKAAKKTFVKKCAQKTLMKLTLGGVHQILRVECQINRYFKKLNSFEEETKKVQLIISLFTIFFTKNSFWKWRHRFVERQNALNVNNSGCTVGVDG